MKGVCTLYSLPSPVNSKTVNGKRGGGGKERKRRDPISHTLSLLSSALIIRKGSHTCLVCIATVKKYKQARCVRVVLRDLGGSGCADDTLIAGRRSGRRDVVGLAFSGKEDKNKGHALLLVLVVKASNLFGFGGGVVSRLLGMGELLVPLVRNFNMEWGGGGGIKS